MGAGILLICCNSDNVKAYYILIIGYRNNLYIKFF